MIIKTFYKNDFTYIDNVNYFDLCREDNFLILKGKNLDLTIEQIDKFILFNDDGLQLENISLK